MKRRGFTLLELIVVIIILGILATLGFTQYMRMVEKGRVAEANSVLGNIRTLQQAYRMEWEDFGTLANIGLQELPTGGTCISTYYFSYNDNGDGTATATRCGTGQGKTPGSARPYTVTVNYDAGTIATSGL